MISRGVEIKDIVKFILPHVFAIDFIRLFVDTNLLTNSHNLSMHLLLSYFFMETIINNRRNIVLHLCHLTQKNINQKTKI